MDRENWPKEIITPSLRITVYKPELDSLKGNLIRLRSAFSALKAETSEPVFGSFWDDRNADRRRRPQDGIDERRPRRRGALPPRRGAGRGPPAAVAGVGHPPMEALLRDGRPLRRAQSPGAAQGAGDGTQGRRSPDPLPRPSGGDAVDRRRAGLARGAGNGLPAPGQQRLLRPAGSRARKVLPPCASVLVERDRAGGSVGGDRRRARRGGGGLDPRSPSPNFRRRTRGRKPRLGPRSSWRPSPRSSSGPTAPPSSPPSPERTCSS